MQDLYIAAAEFEVDPYSATMKAISGAINRARTNDSALSDGEYSTLMAVALTIADEDPASAKLMGVSRD